MISRPSAPPVGIQPGRIAFLGQGRIHAGSAPASDQACFIQVLCWPLASHAWAALTSSWATIKSLRDGSSSHLTINKRPPPPPSWVHEAVPNLGAPFRDNPAEESTLAAWVSRAQVSLSLSVVAEDQRRGKASSPYPASLGECLSGYVDFLEFPGHEPCQLVVAGPLPAIETQQLTSALIEVQKRLGDTPTMQRLAKLPLRTCGDGEVPLPVDFANLVAAAVARFVDAPGVPNPVFDAIRPKLAHVPRRVAALEGHRRR